MTSSEQNIKQTIIEFIADLKECVFRGKELEDITLIEIYFEGMHPGRVANLLVNYLLPHSQEIKSRNEKFFMTQRELFEGLPSDKIDHYISIFSDESRVSFENKEIMWSYFDSLLAQAEKIKKLK